MAEKNESTITSSCLPRTHILQDFRLVWVDGNFNESDGDCQNTLQQLRTILSNVQVFTESSTCVDFLRDISQEKVFVIISDDMVKDLVPQLHSMPQVNTIYISRNNPESDRTWIKEWPKIKDFYTQTESVCKALQLSVKQCNQDSTPMSFVSFDASDSVVDFDQLEPSFMYTQIFKGILLEMKHGENARQDLVAYYREKHKDQTPQPKIIDEFERGYRPDRAIWWYSRPCFIYQMLNHALRLLESDIIVDMGLFIHDLHRQIEQLHREQFGENGGQSFTLYRGQGFSTDAFEKLQKSQGGLLSFNSFVSTSRDADISKAFSESSSDAPDTIGILFVMTIDPMVKSTPFADIVEHSFFGEEREVLFSMHSVFRIDQVLRSNDHERLFEVSLTLTADEDPQLRLLRTRMDEELKGATEWQRLGSLLIKVGHPNKAEALYNKLLTQSKSEVDHTYYNHQLGVIKDCQGDYNGALSYYAKSLEIVRRMLPEDHPDLAITYSNIGSTYDSMGEYPKALWYFEKCLDIQQKYLPANHPNLATSYSNIGGVYNHMADYSKALSFYEKCLHIEENSLPANHPSLAGSYSSIGLAYSNMGKYSEALSYYKNCLRIEHKSLPPNHPSLATSYNNIGGLYNLMGKYSQALSYHEKCIDIRQKSLPANHPDIATSYSNIGSAYDSMGQYSEALSYHEKCLDIQKKSLPINHPNLVSSYNNIGGVYNGMGKYTKALSYFEKCLDIQQKILPVDHPDLAASYNNIGSVYNSMGEYLKARSYHEKCLDIQQKSLPANHPHIAGSYNNIGLAYNSMGECSKALWYFEKCLDIQLTSLPANHSDLATSYNNIGSVLRKMGDHSKAMSYHEKCLDIRRISLPADHPDLAISYSNIGSAYNSMREYSKALPLFQRALDIWQRTLPYDHPNIQTVLKSIAFAKLES